MKFKKLIAILVNMLLFLNLTSPVLAVDQWRQFRHDWYRTAATTYQLTNNGDGNNSAFQTVWKKEFEEWPHANANVILANDILYYSLMDGTVRAINAIANTYQELWVVNTGNSLNNSPVVYDDRVFLVNLRGRVMALNAQTGQTMWEYTVPTDVYSAPLYANGRLFFGGIDGTFYAFDAENGDSGPVWTYKTPYGMIDSSPVYHKGKVMFQSENMHAYALDWKTGNVIWDTPIAGDKTWNGSPVLVRDADRIVFQTLAAYDPSYNNGSTYRDVCDSCPGHYDVGSDPNSDLTVLNAFDTFITSNRPWVNANVVINTETGQEVRNFSYSGQAVSVLPFTSMYWNSIRWGVINHTYLYAEGNRRPWKVNLKTGVIERLSSYSNVNPPYNYSYFVRGDENVETVISGNRIIGGIRKNLAAIDVNTGARYQLQGNFALSDADDATTMNPRTFSSPHYQTHPGDGYTGSNSELIPYKDRVFYVDNGWLIALKPSFGSVSDINTDTTAPSIPVNLQANVASDQVTLTWNNSTDNTLATTYQIVRDGIQIGTSMINEFVDLAVANGQHSYQVRALDWVENQSTLSSSTVVNITGGSSSPSPSPSLSADFNHDGIVNGEDSKLLITSWLTTGGCGIYFCDTNQDSKNNSLDFAWVVKDWGN